MECAECGGSRWKTVDSRRTKSWIRRRKDCLTCGYRMTTRERPVGDWMLLEDEIARLNGMLVDAGLAEKAVERAVESLRAIKEANEYMTEG